MVKLLCYLSLPLGSGETVQHADLVNCDQKTVFGGAQSVNCSTVVVCFAPIRSFPKEVKKNSN